MAASKKSLDPQEQQIGSVYAKSLLAAAKSSGDLEEVVDQLLTFGEEVLAKQPKFIELMNSSRLSGAEKLQLIDRVLQSKASPTLVNFLKVVSQKGRFDCLNAIVSETRRLYNEETGVVEVLVSSATELDESLRGQIVSKLESVLGKKVSLDASVAPEMLGGLKIRVGDTVFDGSLLSQLDRVRKSTYEKSAEQIRAQFDRFAAAQ